MKWTTEQNKLKKTFTFKDFPEAFAFHDQGCYDS